MSGPRWPRGKGGRERFPGICKTQGGEAGSVWVHRGVHRAAAEPTRGHTGMKSEVLMLRTPSDPPTWRRLVFILRKHV